MQSSFIATINPLATLFLCMGIGFALSKLKILPKEASLVLSKLVIWVLYPALCFITMAEYCTIELISANAFNLVLSITGIFLAILISFIFVPIFAKKGTYERCVYRYALTYGNSGYMGDPLILSMFGNVALTIYKIFTIPLSISIYTWGVGILAPKDKTKKNVLFSLLNPPTIAIFVGMIVGITGISDYFPSFAVDTLNSLKGCMGPIVMMLAGCTVAEFNFLKMITNKKIYLVTLFRLVIIPSMIIGSLFLIKTGINHIFGLDLDNSTLYLTFFTIATPLGLNTVVYPKSYGTDAEPGAAMALVSHTLCVISIPIMFTLMTLLFGNFVP